MNNLSKKFLISIIFLIFFFQTIDSEKENELGEKIPTTEFKQMCRIYYLSH